jgi:hypothetical protein
MVGEHQMDYNKRGPQANDNRERGDQKASFRGLPVFEAQSFDVDFTGNPVDLMVREKQCGEWFWLPIKFTGAGGVLNEKASSIAIYSADSDNFEILKATDFVTLATDKKSVASMANGTTNGTTDVDTPGAVASYGTSAPDGDVTALNKNGTNEEGILLMRPNQTYNMASAILAKGGQETGSTFHGHHDFMLSDDIVRKVHVGHYTFYSKSVVKRPKNYVIVEDVFAQGYVGGEGTLVHSPQSFKDMVSQGQTGRAKESLIAVLCTKRPNDHVLDITGRFAPSVYEQFRGDDLNTAEEHYQGSRNVYKALDMGKVDLYKTQTTDEYMSRVKRVNTVCFRGMEMKFDGASNQFVPTQLNTGHWGPNVYAGVKKVRMGENSFMDKQNYGDRMILRG